MRFTQQEIDSWLKVEQCRIDDQLAAAIERNAPQSVVLDAFTQKINCAAWHDVYSMKIESDKFDLKNLKNW